MIALQGPQPRQRWLHTIATGTQCGVENQPQTLEMTSDKQNQAKYVDFCHKPLSIIAVQSPQPQRWWLCTMATWCLKSTPTLELTLEKQNQAKYQDFCQKTLPIIVVQGPQPRRWWLHTWPLGPNVVSEIDTQCLN